MIQAVEHAFVKRREADTAGSAALCELGGGATLSEVATANTRHNTPGKTGTAVSLSVSINICISTGAHSNTQNALRNTHISHTLM